MPGRIFEKLFFFRKLELENFRLPSLPSPRKIDPYLLEPSRHLASLKICFEKKDMTRELKDLKSYWTVQFGPEPDLKIKNLNSS